jgi:hypothetical protein
MANKRVATLLNRTNKVTTKMEAQLEELTGIMNELAEELDIEENPIEFTPDRPRPKKKPRERSYGESTSD